jgi:hypothetical protein
VARVPGRSSSTSGPIKIGANDNLPEQIGFVYEELMDWVKELRDEVAELQDRVQKLETRQS